MNDRVFTLIAKLLKIKIIVSKFHNSYKITTIIMIKTLNKISKWQLRYKTG